MCVKVLPNLRAFSIPGCSGTAAAKLHAYNTSKSVISPFFWHESLLKDPLPQASIRQVPDNKYSAAMSQKTGPDRNLKCLVCASLELKGLEMFWIPQGQEELLLYLLTQNISEESSFTRQASLPPPNAQLLMLVVVEQCLSRASCTYVHAFDSVITCYDRSDHLNSDNLQPAQNATKSS